MKWLKPANAKWILGISISVFVFIHLFYVNLPPCSIHVWRQCNTLSVAQNFYEESYNILEPRVDRRFESDGITGTAFPFYEWILALIYKFTGVHYWVHRLLSLLFTIVAILFSHRFLNNITSSSIVAAIASSLLLWSPELFYHSINAIPDILALCTGFISLYFYSKPDRQRFSTILSFLFLTISGLIKMQYLMIGIFHLVDFIKAKRIIKKLLVQDLLIIVCGLICIIAVFSWYNYSLALIEKSNLRDYGIEVRSASNFNEVFDILKKNLISDFPELLLGFANTLIILFGCYASIFKTSNKYWLHFLGILIIYSIYHLLELKQMKVHHYYMLPIYFSVIAIIYNGIDLLYKKGKYVFILIVMVAQPALSCIRIIPARWGKSDLGISATFSNQLKLEKLKSCIPNDAKVIAGPDESGCIYFYFLHKKGFGYERPNQLTTMKDGQLLLENYIDRGAEYLITADASDVNNQMLIKYFEKTTSYEEFYIIKLKK